jgi:hypothetical protein
VGGAEAAGISLAEDTEQAEADAAVQRIAALGSAVWFMPTNGPHFRWTTNATEFMSDCLISVKDSSEAAGQKDHYALSVTSNESGSNR